MEESDEVMNEVILILMQKENCCRKLNIGYMENAQSMIVEGYQTFLTVYIQCYFKVKFLVKVCSSRNCLKYSCT